MRALRLLITGLLVAAAGLALAGVAEAHSTGNTFVGLQADDAFDRAPAYRMATLHRIAESGAGTVRRTIDWSLVEPKKGHWSWKAYDAQIGAAAKAGLQVLPVLFNVPSWASTRPRTHAKRGTYPPRRMSQFAEFAARAAQRYGPDGTFWRRHPSIEARPIVTWQIWNEPNLPVYWQPRPRAASYVAMLRAAGEAIHTVSPTATIMTAGLPKSRLKGSIELTAYVQQLYAAGAATAFDTLAVNPYAATPEGVVGFLQQIRTIMDAAGDPDGHLYASEFGWSDVGPGSDFRVGAAGQATAIAGAIPQLWAARIALKLDGFVYYSWRDGPPYAGGHDFWGLHTGLLSLNNKAKPAYEAFHDAVDALT